MAFTFGEAHDVNKLLDWLLGIRPQTAKTDDQIEAEARAAAVRLADKASHKLMAGITGDRVNAAWAQHHTGPWQEGDPSWPTRS